MKSKSTTKTVKRLEYAVAKKYGVQSYDFDNIYPQRVLDIVGDSRTASSCLTRKNKFLYGGGFVSPELGNLIVNPFSKYKPLTATAFLRQLIPDLSLFQSVAIHLNFNGAGEIIEVNHIPWSSIRFGVDADQNYNGKVAVYDDWGTYRRKRINPKEINFYDQWTGDKSRVFDRLKSVGEENENFIFDEDFKGMIYIHTPNAGNYPTSIFDPVLEDAITEGKLKRFGLNSVDSNFLASHILVTGASEETTDGANDTEAGNDNEQGANLIDDLREFQGETGAGSILLLEKENPEDKVELLKMDLQDYDGLYEKTAKSSTESIIMISQIPYVLFLSIPGKLGGSNEIKDAVAFYNGETSAERGVLSEIFGELFGENWFEPVEDETEFSIIPYQMPKSETQISAEYFPYYTKNEIRKANGDEGLKERSANSQTLAEKLGVGGTQSLTGILTNPQLSEDQKLGSLKILFGMSEEQALELLGKVEEIKTL